MPAWPAAASRVHFATSLRSTKKLRHVSATPTATPSAMSLRLRDQRRRATTHAADRVVEALDAHACSALATAGLLARRGGSSSRATARSTPRNPATRPKHDEQHHQPRRGAERVVEPQADEHADHDRDARARGRPSSFDSASYDACLPRCARSRVAVTRFRCALAAVESCDISPLWMGAGCIERAPRNTRDLTGRQCATGSALARRRSPGRHPRRCGRARRTSPRTAKGGRNTPRIPHARKNAPNRAVSAVLAVA